MKNKIVLITILSIVFIAITEILIYLVFAFCCWDLNWVLNSCAAVRFIYIICAIFSGIVNVMASALLIKDPIITK